MKKYYLMAPGPSMVPERVLLEMAKPILHHRTKAFENILSKVRRQLKAAFQTKNEVILHASVGSGAMESAVTNCFSPGEKVIVVRSGKFGERWSEQAKRFQLQVIDVDVPWGEAVDPQKIQTLLESDKNVAGVMCQACETSTGTQHPIKELGAVVKKFPNTLLLIDAITALGITEIKTDEWGLDIVVSGSQKAFMLPPGLSMLSFSDKALEKTKLSKLPRYYFDVNEEIKMAKKNQTHFTPAISLISGLSVALDMMEEEGWGELFARHKRLAQATRAGVRAMGLGLFSKAPSDSITAVKSPNGVDGEKLVDHLSLKYGFTIIGGQDQVKGKIFRLGHMGYCGDFDVIAMMSALEMTLKDFNHSFDWGRGVSAASEILHQGIKKG